jgi:FO synthase
VGCIHGSFTGKNYLEYLRAVKDEVPEMHVHAFTPLEVWQGAHTLGISVEKFLRELKEAGLGTLPGTAAEVLDDEVRAVICPDKINTAQWSEVMRKAHEIGLSATTTIMFGHVDGPVNWARHLMVLRDIQADTGGFTEFVPLPFVHTSAPIYLAGVARPGPTLRDNLAVHAMARVMLHGRIDHVQTSWVKLGVEGTRLMLRAGCDDLGGTLMEETISRMAGSEHGSAKTVEELTEIAAGVGRPVRQRTTTYDEVPARA